jgi:hypothetical protein
MFLSSIPLRRAACAALLTCLTSCGTSPQLAAVKSVRGGLVTVPPVIRNEVEKDVKSEGRGKRIMLVALGAGALIATGAAVGASGSAFASGAAAGAGTSALREAGASARVDPFTARVDAEMNLRNRFYSSFPRYFTAYQDTALQNEPRTSRTYAKNAPYQVNNRLTWMGWDEKKDQYYLYVEIETEIVDAGGTVLSRSSSYGESRGGTAPVATSLAALLSPGTFEAHVKDCAESAARYTAEVAADMLGL